MFVMPEEPTGDEFISAIIERVDATYEDAHAFAEAYRRKMADDPEEALAMLEDYIQEARRPGPDREHQGFVEAVAGGPNPDYVAPIINVLEVTYSGLEEEQRSAAFKTVLKYLDGLNFINAQSHVELMRNPHLIADITANRPQYWPGYRRHADFLESNPDWQEVEEYLEHPNVSPYFFTLAVLREGHASEEIKERFYAEHPALVDVSLDGLAVRIYDRALRQADQPGGSFDASAEGQLEKYDDRFRQELVLRLAEPRYIRLPE